MIKIFKKYDWIKISGILLIIAVDILFFIGIASLFSTCTKDSQTNNVQKIASDR